MLIKWGEISKQEFPQFNFYFQIQISGRWPTVRPPRLRRRRAGRLRGPLGHVPVWRRRGIGSGTRRRTAAKRVRRRGATIARTGQLKIVFGRGKLILGNECLFDYWCFAGKWMDEILLILVVFLFWLFFFFFFSALSPRQLSLSLLRLSLFCFTCSFEDSIPFPCCLVFFCRNSPPGGRGGKRTLLFMFRERSGRGGGGKKVHKNRVFLRGISRIFSGCGCCFLSSSSHMCQSGKKFCIL